MRGSFHALSLPFRRTTGATRNRQRRRRPPRAMYSPDRCGTGWWQLPMSMSKQVPRAPGVSLLDPDATTLTLPPPWRRHTHARTHARAPIRQPELTHLFHVLSDSDPRALDGSDSDAGVAAAPIDRSGARSPVSNRMPCHLVNRSHLLVERSSSQADLVSRGRRRGILSRAVATRSAGRGGVACSGVAEQGPRAPREKK